MLRFFLIIFFTIASNNIFSQDFQFIGLLKFDKTNIISYRLDFSQKDGKINGYSITDFQGENETKNKIIGFYEKKTSQFTFTEKDIVYTKSKIIQNDFCFLNFKGKVELNSKSKINGEFSSFFNDGKVCIKGNLNLISSEKAKQKLKKFEKKIQKSSRVSDDNKSKINLEGMIDETKSNVLKKNELTSLFIQSDEIQLEIWDENKEDGDKISIEFDGKKILSQYVIINKKKFLKIKIEKEISVLKIIANNNGDYAPNTAKINVTFQDKNIELISKLEVNETTSIQIIRKNN